MSYLLFILVGYVLLIGAAKDGVAVDEVTWICLSILTAGEVISWRCNK